MIGHTLGHYRILERVGAGGMGEVYRAEDLHLRRDVAIKVLPVGVLADDHARKRFRKEAEALSKLNHPNIQTVYDFSTQDGIDFLVSEYVPGITLSEKLAAHGLALQEILRLGQHLAESLAAAHEQHIVHRDVKPSNLRITPDGRLKILDFGLAKLGVDTLATQTLTETQSIAGTPLYMAPEQKLGESVDARTDIYSAGLVLREMVTGKPPRCREATALTLCPPRMKQIIEKCLEKEPENRYQSARELAVDLRRLAMPQTASNVACLQAPARWRKAPVVAAVAGVLSLTAVLIALNVGGARERLSREFHVAASRPRIESLAVLPLGNLSHDPDQEYFTDGMTEAVIADLAKIKAVKVISRTSVMPYKNSKKSMREIASELHADAVIEGSVMRSEDRVRITVELIDASSDQHLWETVMNVM